MAIIFWNVTSKNVQKCNECFRKLQKSAALNPKIRLNISLKWKLVFFCVKLLYKPNVFKRNNNFDK